MTYSLKSVLSGSCLTFIGLVNVLILVALTALLIKLNEIPFDDLRDVLMKIEQFDVRKVNDFIDIALPILRKIQEFINKFPLF